MRLPGVSATFGLIMALVFLREKAIQLRLQGCTYGQIRRELGVQKSTLSGWLSKLPLGEEQIILLSQNKELSKDISREKFIETFRKKRLTRLKAICEEQTKVLLPLTEKELFIAGLFLYWGEGGKTHGDFSLSNTDPKLVKFFLYWLKNSLNVPINKIKVQLHLYRDMDVNGEISFWSKYLKIPEVQFYKPYIKNSNKEGVTYKGFGHGTCKIRLCSIAMGERVAMSIKAITNICGATDEIFWYN